MPFMLQDLVHKLEVGVGARALRIALAVLVGLLLVVGYNLRSFRNFSTQESMDQAQLARNIAEGRGFTTKYVRPFSMFLIKRENSDQLDSLSPEQRADLYEIKDGHPDIANPPVYPLVLAGLMKIGVVPAHADALTDRPFWWSNSYFARHPADFAIALFNQLLLIGVALLTFFIARRLFDIHVAWLAALLVFAADLLWRFSVSGQSTLLLLLLFMGLVWALVNIQAQSDTEGNTPGRVLGWAALAGVLLGLGMLTRYSYGVVLLPVLGFVLLAAGRKRVPVALIISFVFALVVVPWVVRNFNVSGTPFGTAGYAPVANSAYFPQHQLARSLEPNLSQINLTAIWWKFFTNLRSILTGEIMRLGGGIIAVFFLAGLMIPFRNPAISRVRYFALGALAIFIVAQALGRTALSDDSPEINSENLLVLLLPLVMIYGVGFFLILLDQVPLPLPGLRYVVIGVFAAIVSLPMLFNFLPPKTSPVAFPPYHPPSIQKVSNWMREHELVMSDVPWAVAWYGDRQSVLLTLDAHGQFYQFTDYIKPVSALYLTPVSLDARFLSQWARGGSERSWGALVMAALSAEQLPPKFPLTKSYRLPEQLFLTDWERWLKAD